MHTDRAVTRPSREPVAMRPIVDRQTPVKTVSSSAFGKHGLEVCKHVVDQGIPENQ